MDSTPKISIVTPCYNCAPFLPKTIDSVLEQGLDRWKLILVDDGCTDETPAIIRRACLRDWRIRGTRQPNGGRAKACNFGVARVSAESKYIFFLDADDLLSLRLGPSACGRRGKPARWAVLEFTGS